VNFYYFGGLMGDETSIMSPSVLNKNNFSGVMFTYDATQGDMFVRTAKDIKLNENIKYLIAIRPYTISPQYLQTIHDSINEIDPDRLQINLIAGYIKDKESHINGIVGDINDSSDPVDRSNYMIKFLDTLNNMAVNKTPLDFYVSTTNSYVFEAVKKYNHKIILPYHIYVRGGWSDVLKDKSKLIPLQIENTEVMLTMTPIIRKTEKELDLLTNHSIRPAWKKGEIPKIVSDVAYFTHEQFYDFVDTLENRGINHLLINAVPSEEAEIIVPFINDYVNSRKNNTGEAQ
jgi:hypothetical protein